jgi:hypothetical protein
VGVWKHDDSVCVYVWAEVCGGLGDVEWCECECGCEGWWEYGYLCLFADGGVGCVRFGVFGVWCGVRQVEWEQARCGGRSCDGGRRAALDVAVDIGVRVGLDGVMGVWVWNVGDAGVCEVWGGCVVVLCEG